MKTLVVGGTGMIGSHVAHHLDALGAEVTVGARSAPADTSLVAGYPTLLGDYAEGGLTVEELAGFDSVVFAAGNDVRHVPQGEDEHRFWDKYQISGVPDFVARAKRAGVRRVVQIGSYYHQLRPDLSDTDAYVRARQLADDESRALADADFNVTTLNPPSIVGVIPGVATRRFAKQVAWARGDLAGKVPDTAPPGGTNYMSVRSLAEAVAGALERGESGTAYLIGDENLSFRDYFQMIFDAAGSGRTLVEADEEHPFLPDRFIVQGRGNTLAYEPDATTLDLLRYRRNDVRPMIEEITAGLAR